MWFALATLPVVDWLPEEAAGWVRVEDPHHPAAIARSATGALLEEPPEPGVRWRPASIPVPDGAFEVPGAEAVGLTHADYWHAAGVRGAGIKVAVFDIGWSTSTVDPAVLGEHHTHDCFASTTCEVPFDPLRLTPNADVGVHGWACAEVVRAVAPDAELHLVRTNSFTMLENAVTWAVREGIDVVSMSMSFYNDSFYDGTGPHAALLRELEAGGVLLVTSAGNNARQHWRGPYVDGDLDGRMDGQVDNGIPLALSRDTTVHVTWNQFARCGLTDLDAYVVDDRGRVVGQGISEQLASADRCEPVERVRVDVAEPGTYHLEVHHRRGRRADLLVNVIARGGSLVQREGLGSTADPASQPLAVSVGAVAAQDWLDGPPEGFSAFGPTPTGTPKPDLMAPDRLTTTAYGPVGFTGTSAAAPVVAGLVALVLSDDPALTSREAYERLAAWARPAPGAALGRSTREGLGRVRLAVRDPEPLSCGRRPLLMALLVVPLGWLRRRRGRRVGWSGRGA